MTKSVTFFPSPAYVRCFSIILEIPGSGTGNIPTPHLSLGLISSGRAPPSIPKSSLFPVYGCALGGDGEGTLGSIPALSSSGDILHTLGMSRECSQDPALCLKLTLFGAGFLWDQVWLELPASVLRFRTEHKEHPWKLRSENSAVPGLDSALLNFIPGFLASCFCCWKSQRSIQECSPCPSPRWSSSWRGWECWHGMFCSCPHGSPAPGSGAAFPNGFPVFKLGLNTGVAPH